MAAKCARIGKNNLLFDMHYGEYLVQAFLSNFYFILYNLRWKKEKTGKTEERSSKP